MTKNDYSFKVWNTAVDGSGKEYKSNATYTMGAENDTFYAHWEINRYKVTYDGNGDNVTRFINDDAPLRFSYDA
jgi:uncharacterized repeat protein (TIGR02543 family)